MEEKKEEETKKLEAAALKLKKKEEQQVYAEWQPQIQAVEAGNQGNVQERIKEMHDYLLVFTIAIFKSISSRAK